VAANDSGESSRPNRDDGESLADEPYNPDLPSRDDSLSRFAHLPVMIMAAAITAATAHAGPGNPTFMHAGLWSESNAVGEDIPEGAPVVIGTGDFNGDGIADMVEATPPEGKDSNQHLLTVLLGRADGTIASVASRNVIGSDPRALVVGDFNRDGNLDVIVGDGDGALVEFLGDGKGNMANAGHIADVGGVASLAIGHFTHDGNLDLVVSDFHSNSGVILLGAGNGSFRHVWSFQLPRRGVEFRIATADFNQDGIDDLVMKREDDEDYEVMLGNGNGTFTYAPELSHLRDPNSYCPS
jgi:hypothetical protein